MNLKNGWILGILFFILASGLSALFVFISGLISSESGYMMGVLGVLGLYIATALFSFLYARNAGQFTKKQRTNIGLTYFIGNSALGLIIGITAKIYPYVFIITIAVVSLVFAAVIYWLIDVETLRYVLAARRMKAIKAKAREEIEKLEEKQEEKKVKTVGNAKKSKISSTTKRGKATKKKAKKKVAKKNAKKKVAKNAKKSKISSTTKRGKAKIAKKKK